MSDMEPGSGPARPRDAGSQVLVWMRDEFEALRRQVHALATSVAQQRAMLTELSGDRVAELTTSLAELEGCAAALRNEAARIQSSEHSLGDRLASVVSEAMAQHEGSPQVGDASLKAFEDLLQNRLTDVVADAIRPQLRAAIAARLPELVNEVVQPQVRAALAEIKGCTTELRDEYARLRALRDDLMVRFPRLVETAVERAMEHQVATIKSLAATPPTPPAPAAVRPSATPPPASPVPSPGPSEFPSAAVAPPPPTPPAAVAPPAAGATSPLAASETAGPTPDTGFPAAAPAPVAPAPVAQPPVAQPPVAPAPVAQPPVAQPPVAVAQPPVAQPIAVETSVPSPVSSAPLVPTSSPDSSPGEVAAPRVAVGGRFSGAPAPAPAPAPRPAELTPPGVPPSTQVPDGTVAGNVPAPETAAPAAGGRVRYAEAAAAAAAAAAAVDGIACVLPGMVVGPSLAVGVAEALGRARLRRRRRRRAAPPAAGLYRHDPFAGHVTRRLERFARGRAAPPASTARGMGAAGWATVVLGERDGEEVGIDLSTGGLVLTGPGAADVARAAVTGLLAAHESSTMAAVVAGDLLPAVPPFPGLAQTADLGPAIGELAAEVGRRLQLLADDNVPDAGAYRSKHPDADFPMIVLAATGVGADDLERVRALLRDGARAGVSGIVVPETPQPASGDPASGDPAADEESRRWADIRLDEGATVAEARPAAQAERLAGARLFQLEPDVAAELLGVLASARTDGDHMRPVPDDDESFMPATSAATAPVAVQLLGVYRIEVDGTEIKSGLRAKARELLAFYLLHPEGATLDDAVEALWPEADPRRGSEWFWTALGNLRTKLRQATGQKELKVIDRDGDLYRIEDVFDVDLWSLQHSLKEGAQSRDDAVRQAALDRAVADYDGDLLVGLDWFWLDTPREDLRQRMVDVLVWLGDRRWAAGDARAAWSALQRALEVDPYAEQIYRRIMRLQAKLSRPDDADVTYRRLQAKLDEVDLQPTSETEKLHAEVCPQA